MRTSRSSRRRRTDTLFGPFGVTGPFKYSAEKVHPLDRYAMSPARIQAERDAYDGAIAYLDHNIGGLLDELARRGVLDNTLVIIVSDHGEQFGEHGLLAHGNSVYTQLIHVPLLLRLPGVVPAGVRVEQGVSPVDIPATVMQIVSGAKGPFPGASLARFWSAPDSAMPVDTILAEVTGGFAESDVEPIAKGDLRSVFLDRWHYIIEADGTERLYDVFADPKETRDLAAAPEYADRLGRMRAVFVERARRGQAAAAPTLRRITRMGTRLDETEPGTHGRGAGRRYPSGHPVRQPHLRASRALPGLAPRPIRTSCRGTGCCCTWRRRCCCSPPSSCSSRRACCSCSRSAARAGSRRSS